MTTDTSRPAVEALIADLRNDAERDAAHRNGHARATSVDRARLGYEEWRALLGSKKYPDELLAEFDRMLAQVRREAAAEQREKDAAKLNAISVQTFVSANGLDDVTWGQLMRRAAAFDDAAAAIREQGNDADPS